MIFRYRKNCCAALNADTQFICPVNIFLGILRTGQFLFETMKTKPIVNTLPENSAGLRFTFQNNE